MENLDNKLWQSMDKNDLDLNNKISDKDWHDFIDKYSIIFAEYSSEIARDLFQEYLNSKGGK